MAEVLPIKHPTLIHSEALALGASAETLAGAGATIPQNTGEIWVVTPSGDSLHWAASETPTSSHGNQITLGHAAIIPHSLQKRAQFISDDGSDVTCILIYMRGASRSDLAYALTEPF